MAEYNVKFTDISKTPIDIEHKEFDDSTSLKLFGKNKVGYGSAMNQNFLRLLENFSCPEDESNPGFPDPIKSNGALSSPISGQLWYNETCKSLYVWNTIDSIWIPLASSIDVATNWGAIFDGEQIPKPVAKDGTPIEYENCYWVVGPYLIPFNTIADFIEVTTDIQAVVNSKYTVNTDPDLISGFANYMIIGIRNNIS